MILLDNYEINDLALNHFSEINIWCSNFDIWKKGKTITHSLTTSNNLLERLYNEINRE